ncbi:cytochrome c550 [Gracilibacillus alcaliphilus]|uniref:cytochrome c550 n=1 Tax=Gracilibacillus alcaliphilus TaxID=1401441 RepID=UPI00195E0FE5|nr:cytochrome c [Gracilibacillus alcaliphilus]MBM7675001.1 cytochrome c550 [Gracilibacillus alcaliphilus]
MKKNPIIPFALIAVLGILTMIIVSAVGVNQQEKIANGGENGETAEAQDPETLIQSCIGCHGGDLEGGSGPALQDVSSRLDQDQITDIIINGTDGGMPGGLVTNEEAEVLAEWLVENH